MPNDLEEEFERARLAYVTDESENMDTDNLRIQTPKEMASLVHKRRAVSPMPSDTGSDMHEWDTEFTPAVRKVTRHVYVGKQLDYMYDSEDELNSSWAPCLALTMVGACILGTWSLIGMQVMGY